MVKSLSVSVFGTALASFLLLLPLGVVLVLAVLAPAASGAPIDAGGPVCRVESSAVYCWGTGGNGQLGQGNSEDVGDSPGELQGLAYIPLNVSGVTSVASDSSRSCALGLDGSLRCWGFCQSGYCASDTSDARVGDQPGDIEAIVPVDWASTDRVVQVEVDFRVGCACFANGGVRCWGSGVEVLDTIDDVGGNDIAMSTVDFFSFSTPDAATQVSLGEDHACVLFAGGRIRCWGSNQYGQSGTQSPQVVNGEQIASLGYIPFSDSEEATAVSCSPQKSAALFANGKVRVWGADRSSILDPKYDRDMGNIAGDMPDLDYMPVNVTEPIVQVDLSENLACVRMQSGGIICWGDNDHGQAGQNSVMYVNTAVGQLEKLKPIVFSDTSPATYVSAANTRACALFASGGMRCWGRADAFLGYGTTDSIGDEPGETEALPYLEKPACGGTPVSTEGVACYDGNTVDDDGCTSCRVDDGYFCTGVPSRCYLCGDGVLDETEECDDGNLTAGDGCNGVCLVETSTGWSCDEASPTACQLCQDGQRQGTEACDDGNDERGDGCNEVCGVEQGWSCVGSPSSCSFCGDGQVGGTEGCDDGNLVLEDGCNTACVVEDDYDCAGSPSVCQRCGDSRITGTEECDDGNVLDDDGCTAVCDLDPAFQCTSVTGITICARCGDGNVTSVLESCDDGNALPNDGCSEVCITETGWTCPGQPSDCRRCGNGILETDEECDDGNVSIGDGCSSTCRVEANFGCNGEPSECQSCPNGRVEGTEACDDGNASPFDGCFLCQVEEFWTCTRPEGQLSTCTSCGNGVLEVGEDCDDGNRVDDDGCTLLCAETPGYTCIGAPSVCARDSTARVISRIQPTAGPADEPFVVTVFGQLLHRAAADQWNRTSAECLFGGGAYVSDAVESTVGLDQVLLCPYGDVVPQAPEESNATRTNGTRRRQHLLGATPVLASFAVRWYDNETVSVASGGKAAAFALVPPFNVSSVQPTNADTSGGTPVTVTGGPFVNATAVSFGLFLGDQALVATLVDEYHLTAVTGFHNRMANMSVSVSQNYRPELGRSAAHEVTAPASVQFHFRECLAGSAAATSADACELCPPGRFARDPGSRTCAQCSAREYQPVAGQSFCAGCPTGTSNSADPRINITQCLCDEGRFTPSRQPGTECLVCPPGGRCDGGLAAPVPLPGYWIEEVSAFDAEPRFLPCQNADACPGGQVRTCDPRYTGHLCGACAPGHFDRDGACVECPNGAEVLFAGFILLGFVVAAFLLHIVRKQGTQNMAAITILASFYQTLQIVVAMAPVWPESVQSGVRYLTFPFVLNMDFLASECSLPVSFEFKWMLTLTLPFFFAFLFACIYATLSLLRCIAFRKANLGAFFRALTDFDMGALRRSIVHAMLLLLILLYTVLAGAVLSFFDCRQLPDSTWVLQASPDRTCFGDWWMSWLPVAISAGVVYVVAVPLFVVLIIAFNRDRLNDAKFAAMFGSLYLRYRMSNAGWEGVVLLRKLLVLMAARLVSADNPALQASLVLGILVVAMRFQDVHRPMAVDDFNRLEAILLYCSVGILLAGVNFASTRLAPDSVIYVLMTVFVWTLIGISIVCLLWAVISVVLRIIRMQRGQSSDGGEMRRLMSQIIADGDVALVRAWMTSAEIAGDVKRDFLTMFNTFLWANPTTPAKMLIGIGTEGKEVGNAIRLTAQDFIHPSLPLISSFARHVVKRTAVPVVGKWLRTGGEQRGDRVAMFTRVFSSLASFKAGLGRRRRKPLRNAFHANEQVALADAFFLALGRETRQAVGEFLLDARHADSVFAWAYDQDWDEKMAVKEETPPPKADVELKEVEVVVDKPDKEDEPQRAPPKEIEKTSAAAPPPPPAAPPAAAAAPPPPPPPPAPPKANDDDIPAASDLPSPPPPPPPPPQS